MIRCIKNKKWINNLKKEAEIEFWDKMHKVFSDWDDLKEEIKEFKNDMAGICSTIGLLHDNTNVDKQFFFDIAKKLRSDDLK